MLLYESGLIEIEQKLLNIALSWSHDFNFVLRIFSVWCRRLQCRHFLLIAGHVVFLFSSGAYLP